MIVGIPMDYRCMQFISDAISTFGHFHHSHHDDPLLVRTLAYVSFPATTLVPQDVVHREYADFRGSCISWSAPIYIFSADFSDILPADEDPIPLDGVDPHPVPQHANDFPGFQPLPVHNVHIQNEGWDAWEEPTEQDDH